MTSNEAATEHDLTTRLGAARRRAGLSQLVLANRAGIYPGAISDIERRRVIPTENQKRKLAEALQIKAEELFGDMYDKIPLRSAGGSR